MGQKITGGNSGNGDGYKPHKEPIMKALVVEDIRIIEREKIVDIPVIKYKDIVKETTRYNTKDEDTIKYNVVEKDTTKYVTKEEGTIKYVPKEVECEKPVVVLKTYERPVIEEKKYEKPILEEKTYEIVLPEDIQAVRDLTVAVKELNLQLPELKKNLDSIREYKLIEETISVPKIQYHTVRAERIEWVDVKKERPR